MCSAVSKSAENCNNLKSLPEGAGAARSFILRLTSIPLPLWEASCISATDTIVFMSIDNAKGGVMSGWPLRQRSTLARGGLCQCNTTWWMWCSFDSLPRRFNRLKCRPSRKCRRQNENAGAILTTRSLCCKFGSRPRHVYHWNPSCWVNVEGTMKMPV